MNVCLEIVRIDDSTNETKVCILIEKVTGINLNQDCLECYHLLLSDKKNKIIVKFSRQKDAESVLQNKHKNKIFNPRSIDTDSKKIIINEGLCRYYKFLWSKCKKLWTEEWIDAFWVSKGQFKLRIEPEGGVSRISHIQDL